jgi:pyruvate formate lyase activating enzyme
MDNASMNIPICDITPFTLQDFPEHTACILWFGGCNMRCVYCHNPELVTGKKKKLPTEDVISFLESRKSLLDGVVLSGGECTLSPQLPEFIRKIKIMGFKIKLDTNGNNPEMLEDLLVTNQLDYVAIDYKSPKEKFKTITGIGDFESFHNSLKLLCNGNTSFEVRTTVHTDLLQENDIVTIIKDLAENNFRGTYYIQNFIQNELLSPLPEQKQKLDLSLIEKPKNFTLDFRNFY